jgi:GT2 family glycosyltransferase
MSRPLLFVIILNHHHYEDTLDCLASLYRNDYENIKTVLLDTVSARDMTEFIHRQYPQVQIIPLPDNLGYAGNNNIGIKLALAQGADWVLILNDDTELDAKCLSFLMETAALDPNIGIVGPMVYHFNEPDVIQSAGGILDKHWNGIHLGQNETDQGQFPSAHAVNWISGCAILVRRALIEQVGMLDPDYFLYWEEIDWCVRARRAGWKIIHVPQAKLWHKGVQRDYQPNPLVTYYSTRNHLFLLAKHKASLGGWIYTIFQISRSLISWTVKPQWRSKHEHRNAMWWGVVDFFRHRQGPMPSRSLS